MAKEFKATTDRDGQERTFRTDEIKEVEHKQGDLIHRHIATITTKDGTSYDVKGSKGEIEEKMRKSDY
jgi:hypothetical protein